MSEPRDYIGAEAFTILRAEDEPWLMDCFVPPPHFDRVRSERSVLVLGESGSGKTALCRALQMLNRTDETITRLLVPWRPDLSQTMDTPSIEWVREQARHLLDACVGAVVHLLAQSPEYYEKAPEWVKARWAWFIHTYTLGDPRIRWGAVTMSSYPGISLLRHILGLSPVPVLYENAPLHQIISEIASALAYVDIAQIWVVVDGLEEWSEVAPEYVASGLRALLSTLGLFEHPALAFKLFLPLDLEPLIAQAGGVVRRRVDVVHLRWKASDLRRIVERRLALVFGRPTFALEDLCNAPGFLKYLEYVGATSPREWLDQTAVLVEYALEHPEQMPISEKKWLELRERRPPHFYLDERRREAVVGGRRISLEGLPSPAYDMLRYLYHHAGQVVTRDEIYFYVYENLDYVPRPGDARYRGPATYRGRIDNLLWRLRKAIEPEPESPMLLITRRGKGIILKVRV